MIDLKMVLTYVMQQGLQDFGYGVRGTVFTQPTSTSNIATVSFARAGAQEELDRPLITLMRPAPMRPIQFYLGNVALDYLGSTNIAPMIQVQDRIRLRVEAAQDEYGGQVLIDQLMLQIPTILLQNWDAMTFPEEAGGYGMQNVTFSGGADTAESFTLSSGQVIYTNYFDVSAIVSLDAATMQPPVSTITAIQFIPQIEIGTLD